MYCLVEWGVLTEDEAFAAFDYISEHDADQDGEIGPGEMEAAVKGMEAMTEAEIEERVEGASNL
jgi:hypothetical protein